MEIKERLNSYIKDRELTFEIGDLVRDMTCLTRKMMREKKHLVECKANNATYLGCKMKKASLNWVGNLGFVKYFSANFNYRNFIIPTINIENIKFLIK